jgi:capsular polysaccharide transport system permease protein
MLLGAPIEPPDLATTVQIYGLAALLGFSFALVTNAIADVLPALAPFLKLFRWALFITSGIYNSLSTMSKLEAGFVWYNPLIHLAEYQRNAFDPGYPVFYPRLWYPELVLVGLLFFGLTAERALTRRGRGMNNFIV